MEELRLDQGLSKPRSDIQTTEQLVGYGADSSNGGWTSGSLGSREMEGVARTAQTAGSGGGSEKQLCIKWNGSTSLLNIRCGCNCLSGLVSSVFDHSTYPVSCRVRGVWSIFRTHLRETPRTWCWAVGNNARWFWGWTGSPERWGGGATQKQ